MKVRSLLRIVVLATLTALLSIPISANAQTGKQFFVELSPIYFLYEGGGGAFGREKGRWQNGFAFSTFNPDKFYSQGKLSLTGSISAVRTMSFEPFTKFYFSKERKWLYLGLNIVPEFYTLEDDKTGEQALSVSAYAKPKIGCRWFPFKRIFYVDAGYTMSFKIFESELTQISSSQLQYADFVGAPELSIGVRIK